MPRNLSAPIALLAIATLSTAAACSSSATARKVGQTEFVSAPPLGNSVGNTGVGRSAGGAANSAAAGSNAVQAPAVDSAAAPTRTVEETDLYRLEGNRLYFLNGYRGLMVFDVTDVDHPALIGRSPIYGTPVDMIVRNGIATVVVADWYGQLDDGTPFHGSIVRGLDATDPANIKVLGEAKLGGWVRDDRVVGNVIYAVSEDYGWSYGWDASGTSSNTETVIVSSVSFANDTVTAVGRVEFPGFTGIFNVTPTSILLAHDAISGGAGSGSGGVSGSGGDTGAGGGGGGTAPDTGSASVDGGPAVVTNGDGTQLSSSRTELLYLDTSDPGGQIVQRGSIRVRGQAQGWGADNGRWNLDFADGKTARVVGCLSMSSFYGGYCGSDSSYALSIVDFSDPGAPVLASELDIPAVGYGPTARFDTSRLYLSPSSTLFTGAPGSGLTTPFQVYDLTDPKAPALAGTLTIPGNVWNILPAPGLRLFALGNDESTSASGLYSSTVSLKYLDVTTPASPKLLGTSTFGQGWAWTPAAGTFKAFTMDATQGLVVLPFSGWDDGSQQYNDGLQLIDFTASSITTGGAAHTRGWVERGIFVQNRLVSLSDLSLAVVDYTNHAAPTVTAELTLARNVITAQPQGTNIAEISSDWWDHDQSWSEVRLVPVANAEETTDAGNIPTLRVDGVNAQVFMNGTLAYVVTNVRVPALCDSYGRPTAEAPATASAALPAGTTAPAPQCYGRAQQIQVVDLSNGIQLRGKVRLPIDGWGWYGWGWGGCGMGDWFWGNEVVQVEGDALAFRRWAPIYDASGTYIDSNSDLWIADLSAPDAPTLGSVSIVNDARAWWGNLQVAGNVLYSGHYEWQDASTQSGTDGGSVDDGGTKTSTASTTTTESTVRYYADRIDLSDRAHPRVAAKINVPGLIVGGSADDPSLVYTIDYLWNGDSTQDEFNVLRLGGDTATLLSHTPLDGWVGTTFVRGKMAYLSAQRYDASNGGGATVMLHALDLGDPSNPIDRPSTAAKGWSWLLDVEGDRAIVQSGWDSAGVDIYQLVDGQAPAFRQFTRTLGWSANGVSRQGNTLFLSSGYWGVQRVELQ
jgi:hypothetical protein